MLGVDALLSNVYLQRVSAKAGEALGEAEHAPAVVVDSCSVAHHSASPVFSQKGFRINIMRSELDAYS